MVDGVGRLRLALSMSHQRRERNAVIEFDGAVEANEYNIGQYLAVNYRKDGSRISPAEARQMMTRYPQVIAKAREFGSYAYYVGDKIAEGEGLDHFESEGCQGHESLDGAHMGEAVYCDGSCRND
jgi:hypothetical protein